MKKDNVKKINLGGAMTGHSVVAWKPLWEVKRVLIPPLTPTFWKHGQGSLEVLLRSGRGSERK